MRVMKGRLGMDLSIMGLVLKTDGVTGQVGSPGYHGNHVKFDSSLFDAREPHSKKRTVFSCFHGSGCYQGNPLKQFDGSSRCPNPFVF